MDNNPSCVYRGGGWSLQPSNARVAVRGQNAPGNRFINLGVRLVRLMSPIEQLAEVKNGQ